jgi:dihydroxyacetone kinase
VAVATGGGFGHLPLFVGYVATGLVDGCAVGNMFASPSVDVISSVTREIDAGRGVLYVYGNYGGDRINFETAAELAEDDDIRVLTRRGADDVLSAPVERASERRGIAGIWFGYAVAATAARTGAEHDTVAGLTGRALERTRSVGVALSGTTLPGVGHPNFVLEDGEMEIGTGLHGEPGIRRGPLRAADDVADELVSTLLPEIDPDGGDEVAVLVNGVGATPLEELYILYGRIDQRLADAGLRVRHCLVGEYATSLDMAAASLSLCQLDPETTPHVDVAMSHERRPW